MRGRFGDDNEGDKKKRHKCGHQVEMSLTGHIQNELHLPPLRHGSYLPILTSSAVQEHLSERVWGLGVVWQAGAPIREGRNDRW